MSLRFSTLAKASHSSAQTKALSRVLPQRTKLDKAGVQYKPTIWCAVAPRATECKTTISSGQ